MRLFAPIILTPCFVLASIGWLSAAAIIVADLIWFHSAAFGNLGLLIAGGAAVLNVKSWLISKERRERALFDLGRESGLRAVSSR